MPITLNPFLPPLHSAFSVSPATMRMSRTPQLPPELPTAVASPELDLVHRPSNRKEVRRRLRNPSRVRRTGASSVGKRSRPGTPFLKWKVGDRDCNEVEGNRENPVSEIRRRCCRKLSGGTNPAVSARKLAAGLWRLQSPEGISGLVGGSGLQRGEEQLGFQNVGQVEESTFGPKGGKAFGVQLKHPSQSSHSFTGIQKFGPSCQFSNLAMEGATKWGPICLNESEEISQIHSQRKHLHKRGSAVSVAYALEAELEQARVRIQELETEYRTSKKQIEHVVKKVSEEKSLWRRREHEKIRAFIDDIKAETNRERKNRRRVEIANSKLVDELADAKIATKQIIQDYEKERKARELLEEVCDELAKEIGEDKAGVEALKRESMKFRDEVEEERKMLQMAEVWREERVQMKLVDAKLALENKYSLMSKLIEDIETFLRARGATPDVKEMREAVLLKQTAADVNLKDIKEFSYKPPNPDDILSVFEDVNFGEMKEREIETCNAFGVGSHASKIHTASPEVNGLNTTAIDRDGEEDESGWETVSQLEDQGSSYSPEGSIQSVNKKRGESKVSKNGMEWEGNGDGDMPITEITEVCSAREKPLKKVSSIARIWKSCPNNGDSHKMIEGVNGRASNERMFNGGIETPDRWSSRGGLSPPGLGSHLSSPNSRNAQITRMKKGCIPLGTQKHNLKTKLLEAKMETQKVQLRQVLKQTT